MSTSDTNTMRAAVVDRYVVGSAPERVEDFDFLFGLVASGELTVVHDHIYDLEDIVEAHRRVDTGHKRGNVIVRPSRREERQT